MRKFVKNPLDVSKITMQSITESFPVLPSWCLEQSKEAHSERSLWRGYDDPYTAVQVLSQKGSTTEECGPSVQLPSLSPLQPLAILFTDMVESTARIYHLGDEKAQVLLRLHNRMIRSCLRLYRGQEHKHTGDGVMASFASISSAVTCAMAMQKAFAIHNRHHPEEQMQIRIGANAGEPLAEEGQLFGAAVNAAARLCARALPGQILVSDVVRQLLVGKKLPFVHRGRITLKGFSERMRVYEVAWQEER
jgi:class 3 adenylate cyclase